MIMPGIRKAARLGNEPFLILGHMIMCKMVFVWLCPKSPEIPPTAGGGLVQILSTKIS
jgi:hypothetical protein